MPTGSVQAANSDNKNFIAEILRGQNNGYSEVDRMREITRGFPENV